MHSLSSSTTSVIPCNVSHRHTYVGLYNQSRKIETSRLAEETHFEALDHHGKTLPDGILVLTYKGET